MFVREPDSIYLVVNLVSIRAARHFFAAKASGAIEPLPEPTIDLTAVQQELEALRLKLCSCENRGLCLGCVSAEFLSTHVCYQMSAASDPDLLQHITESEAKAMYDEFTRQAKANPELANQLMRLAGVDL